MEPNSIRIIQDIEDFGNVLDEGSVIPECRLRHGHRQLSHSGGRVLKRKVTNRQRKHLLKMGSIHPDAEEALTILLDNGRANVELAPAEVHEALEIEELALAQSSDVENDEEDDLAADYEGGV
jgi:hypothetical protein